MAYGNDPDIRSYVEEIVPTYHAAKDDLKLHGETYKKLFNKATEIIINSFEHILLNFKRGREQ